MANRCDPHILKALGREASEREVARIKREALRLKQLAEINRNDPLAVEALWGQFKDSKAARNLAARRVAARNYAAEQKLVEWRRSTEAVQKNPDLGLKALTTGAIQDFKGSQDNVLRNVQHDVEARRGALWNELEDGGVSEYARSPTSYDAIGEAVWDLKHGTDAAVVAKKHGQMAAKAARVFIKHDEAARVDLNREGATINDNPARIANRSVDPNKVAKAGGASWGQGFAAWKADAQKMDWQKSFEGKFATATEAERNALLERIYANDVSGAHPHFSTGQAGFGRASVARRQSFERDIIFSNARDEINYMKKYARGENIAEQVSFGLESAARDIQIMRKFGPNPKQTWSKFVDGWMDEIRNDTTISEQTRVSRMKKLQDENNKQLRSIWPSILDETGAPGDNNLAKFIAFFRGASFISARLGLAGLSSVGDIPLRMKYSRYWGEEASRHSVAEGAKHLVRTFNQLSAAEAKLAAKEGGFRLETLTRPIGLTPEEELGLGGMARFSQHVMKWASHSFLNNGQHVGAFVADGSRFASYRGLKFEQLNEGTQRALRQFAISADEWDVLRRMQTEKYGNEIEIFQPGNIREMPVSEFRKLVRDENPTEEQMFRAQTLLADKFRNMLGEMATNFTSAPSLSMRARLTLGTKRGTLEGELLRTGLSLKSWVAKYMYEGLGGELHGYGADRLSFSEAIWNTLTHKGGGRKGLAQLITAGVVAGYAWAAMNDIAKGKTPVDPTGEHAWEAFFRAFAFQGLGLITDFTLAEERANTDAPLSVGDRVIDILGPGLGTMVDFGDLVQRTGRAIVSGEWREKRGKLGQQMFSMLYHNIPGNNVYWAKYALDYLVANNISNLLNPGYARRLEDRAKQRGQTYLLGAAPK